MTVELAGKRVLVVEDEMLVAMLIEDMLTELGCETVGPASDLDTALRLATNAAFDAAVLDVNLNGQDSEPVARALLARGRPFVFATGYGADAVKSAYAHTERLQKPFRQDDLERAMRAVLARPSRDPTG